MNKYTLFFHVAAVFFLLPASIYAHQPRLPHDFPVAVSDPEISKAYYSELSGTPQEYTIESDKRFILYINITVPDIAGQKTDVSAVIFKNGDVGEPLAFLDARATEWKPFFEPFGHDNYLMGPEFEKEVGPGKYEVRVFSEKNDSKYSLAIGKIESFDFKETANAINVIPELKHNFFNKSPIDFILSPFGVGYILAMFLLAFIVGLFYKLAQKPLKNKLPDIPGKRGLKIALAAWLLLVAMLTTWNAALIFVSGLLAFFAFSSNK